MNLDIKTFLQMGGYGAYIWSAYTLVTAALLMNILLSRRYFKRVIQQIKNNQDGDNQNATEA